MRAKSHMDTQANDMVLVDSYVSATTNNDNCDMQLNNCNNNITPSNNTNSTWNTNN